MKKVLYLFVFLFIGCNDCQPIKAKDTSHNQLDKPQIRTNLEISLVQKNNFDFKQFNNVNWSDIDTYGDDKNLVVDTVVLNMNYQKKVLS